MSLLEDIKSTGFKGAILLSKNEEIILKSAFGYADSENKTLNTIDTKFRIASVTKQFTALSILKLYEDKQLNLSDPIDKYINGVTKGDIITIHHILSNTSGIKNFSLDLDFISLIDEDNFLETLINIFKAEPLMFEPGEKFFYSISGYLILQYIIEKVSGLDYESYLKKNFFNQLNIRNTGLESPTKKIDNKALPYKTKDILAIEFDMRIAGGGGGLYSTISDLFIWANAVNNYKLLKKEIQDLMFEKHIKADEVNSYGYGMIISQTKDYIRYYHPGGGFGVNSFYAYFPNSNYLYIMLSNYEEKDSFNETRRLLENYIESKG